MKKALLVLGVIGLALTLAGPAMAAKDMKGMWGPGYFTPDAPVGVRYWATPKVAVDIGLGVHTMKILDKTKAAFDVDFGIPFVLAGGDETLFFVRPGFAFASVPLNDKDKSKTIQVRGSLGVEHFFSDRFSLEVAHGIYFQNYDPGTTGSKKVSTFHTEAFGISSIGFHYYLFPMK